MFIPIFLPLELNAGCLVLLDANIHTTTCLVPDEYLSALQQPVCWNDVALTHSRSFLVRHNIMQANFQRYITTAVQFQTTLLNRCVRGLKVHGKKTEEFENYRINYKWDFVLNYF